MKNGKLFGKIHVLDIIIILVAIMVVITAVNRFSGTEIISFGNGEEVTIRYQVLTYSYEPEYFESMLINDRIVYDKEYLDGKIVNIEIIDKMVNLIDNNGDVVRGIHPTEKYALVTIEATAEYKNPIYTVGQQEIREGLPHFLTTEYSNLSGIVSSIEIME